MKLVTGRKTYGSYEGWKPGLFVNFGQFSCSWIRIRIPYTDPDPGQPNHCGSGTTILHVRTTSKPNGDAPLEDRVLRDALKELEHIDSSLANVQKAGVEIFWKSSRSCKCYSSQNGTEPNATFKNGRDPDPT